MSKEQILKEFIGKFCNDHNGKIRFLRGVFYDEQDGAERILNFISKAIDKTKKETREETIKEIEESLPEQAPPILDILGTEEEHNHNERIRARINGFNSCLGVIKEIINKLKN